MKAAIAAIIYFALASPAMCTGAHAIEGKVVSVADGDTLTILDQYRQSHRIRLAYIDAPESGMPHGAVAKRSLSNLAFGRHAQAQCKETDRYGRSVCTVFVDGNDVNSEQVARGYAWVYAKYAPPRSPLYRLEHQARNAGIGLWEASNPVPPWEWRKK